MAGATGVAVADTVTVPEAVEPSAGVVIVTAGGVEPGCVCDRTVTVVPLICSRVSVTLFMGLLSVSRCCGSTTPCRM